VLEDEDEFIMSQLEESTVTTKELSRRASEVRNAERDKLLGNDQAQTEVAGEIRALEQRLVDLIGLKAANKIIKSKKLGKKADK
jgi:hypothetical protein